MVGNSPVVQEPVVFLGPWLLEFFHKRGIRRAEAITDEHCVEAFADLVHDRHGKVPDPQIPRCATWALLAVHVAGSMFRLKSLLVDLFRKELEKQRRAAKRRRAAKAVEPLRRNIGALPGIGSGTLPTRSVDALKSQISELEENLESLRQDRRTEYSRGAQSAERKARREKQAFLKEVDSAHRNIEEVAGQVQHVLSQLNEDLGVPLAELLEQLKSSIAKAKNTTTPGNRKRLAKDVQLAATEDTSPPAKRQKVEVETKGKHRYVKFDRDSLPGVAPSSALSPSTRSRRRDDVIKDVIQALVESSSLSHFDDVKVDLMLDGYRASVSLLDGDADAEVTHLEHLNSWLALQKYCTLSVKKLRALGKVAASTPSVEAIQKREHEFLSTLEFEEVPPPVVGDSQTPADASAWYIRPKERLTTLIEEAKLLKPDHDFSTVNVVLKADGAVVNRNRSLVSFHLSLLGFPELGLRTVFCSPRKETREAVEHDLVSSGFLDQLCSLKENGVHVRDVGKCEVVFHVCCDMKFLLLSTGLKGATSNHPCVFCCLPKDQLDKIPSASQLRRLDDFERNGEKEKFCQSKSNLFRRLLDLSGSEEVATTIESCIVFDPLHLMLRVTDKLEGALVSKAEEFDAITQAAKKTQASWTKFEASSSGALKRLERLFQEEGAHFKFYQDAKTKGLTHTTLMGPCKKKLLRVFAKENAVGRFMSVFEGDDCRTTEMKEWASNIGKLYSLLNVLIKMLYATTPQDVEAFKTHATDFVATFISTFPSGASDLTVYTHILTAHAPTILHRHGGALGEFVCENMERRNYEVRQRSSHCSNRHPDQLAKKPLQDLAIMDSLCRPMKAGSVEQHQKCGHCDKPGHNIRGCPERASSE